MEMSNQLMISSMFDFINQLEIFDSINIIDCISDVPYCTVYDIPAEFLPVIRIYYPVIQQ